MSTAAHVRAIAPVVGVSDRQVRYDAQVGNDFPPHATDNLPNATAGGAGVRSLAPAPGRPVLPALPPTRHEVALGALVTFWDALEGMPDDDVRALLAGTGSAFLLGLDVGAVLDALARDRMRRDVARR